MTKRMDVDNLLTGPEIAFLTDARMATFDNWRNRNGRAKTIIPEPDLYFGMVPVWELKRVTAWLDSIGRTYDVKAWREYRDAGGFRRKSPANAKTA